MISYTQAVILGLLQGFSELFPISSLGHSVILPTLLGWNINQNDPFFLTFLVATHFATAVTLFGFFWRDWVRILKGMFLSVVRRTIPQNDVSAKLGWLLVVGTIPAGILGLVFEHPLRALFASAQSAAFFLILNGVMLYGAEHLRRKARSVQTADSEAPLAKLTWTQAILVGTAQTIALIPGFSRSGASMGGALLADLNNEDAARYSFLLATPIIGAASLLKLPELLHPENHGLIGPAIVGGLCSAVTAYLSVKFLMRFFRTESLMPFAVYSVIAGVAVSGYFLL